MNGQPDKIIFKFILHRNCFPALKQYDLPHAFNLQACKCPTGHFFRGNSVLWTGRKCNHQVQVSCLTKYNCDNISDNLKTKYCIFFSKSFNNTTSKTVYASGKMKASSRRRRRLCRQMICKGFFIFKLLLSGFVHILYDTIWTQCSFLSIDGSGSCLSTPSPASTPELWPSSPSSLSSSPLWVFPSPLNVTFCF